MPCCDLFVSDRWWVLVGIGEGRAGFWGRARNGNKSACSLLHSSKREEGASQTTNRSLEASRRINKLLYSY